jgi:poly(3-hydroxybutyrate) depolymerase
MQRGPETDVEATQRPRVDHPPWRFRCWRFCGEADHVVATANTIALVRQYLRFNDHPAVPTPMHSVSSLPAGDTERHEIGHGRMATTREWHRDRRLVVRYVSIASLGHAWSGGDDALPYNDAHGPDATAMVADFVRDALS